MHFTIVSYTFPPSKEIGGRRWAKFSQQLIKKGNEVTVVCANDNEHKDWYKNEFAGIDVHVLPKHYPDWLSGVTRSFKEKVFYFIYTKIFSSFSKQNYFDRGYAWKKPMLSELERIQSVKPIDVLVVTGAPFSLLYYGAEFKLKYKKVKYVGDLRDPWTWGTYYGYPNLTASKKKFQQQCESTVIDVCDMVCFPTEHMGNILKGKYPNSGSKLYLLPHAYDPEKFPNESETNERSGFIYGGTLYDGIEEYVKKLIEIVKKNPESGFIWDVYSATNYPLLSDKNPIVSIKKHPLIPEELLFKKIRSAKAYLAFFPFSDKDLVSTKFFEIVYTKTPILYIGEEGDVAKFIRENRLGVHVLPENMEKELPIYLNGNIPFEEGFFDVTQFTFSNVTDNFLKALNSKTC